MPYKDPEKRKEYMREYRRKNKDKLKELNKVWRDNNPERAKKLANKAALKYYKNNQDDLLEKARLRNNTKEWKEYQKQWSEKNKDIISEKNKQRWKNDEEYRLKIKNRTKEYRKQRVQEINEIKREIGCNNCDENDPCCLDFHHKDPSEKTSGISELVHACYSIDCILEEVEKCIILCSNCHRKLHSNIGDNTCHQ